MNYILACNLSRLGIPHSSSVERARADEGNPLRPTCRVRSEPMRFSVCCAYLLISHHIPLTFIIIHQDNFKI